MSNLEDRRRAIGRRLTDERRAIGRRLVDERRAIGQAMIDRRTGQSQADEINALIREPRKRPGLRALEPRGAIAAQRGRGIYDPVAAGHSGGGGIASPLTEGDYAARTYWGERSITSSDGLLTIRIKAIKAITMTDASGAEVIQQFAEPPA
jgi:hypothetical protein